jgi:hypothetical protein
MRTTTVLLLILLPFVALRAQDLVLEEEEEIRRYTVEIIIFKYAQEVATGSEIFPADEPVPEILPLDDLPLEEEIPPIVDMPEAELPLLRDIAFVLLEEENYTLDETMRRLERLEVYEPLMHFGWTQATWPEEETQPIELASLATPPAGLDGSLTLYLGRYLHLVVDLELDAEHTDGRNPALDDTASNYGDYRAIDEFGCVISTTRNSASLPRPCVSKKKRKTAWIWKKLSYSDTQSSKSTMNLPVFPCSSVVSTTVTSNETVTNLEALERG